MGGKKGAENTKKAAGNARKAEAAAQKAAAEDANREAAQATEWSKGTKSNAKKYVQGRHHHSYPFPPKNLLGPLSRTGHLAVW